MLGSAIINNTNCDRMDDNGDRMIGGSDDGRRTMILRQTIKIDTQTHASHELLIHETMKTSY